MIIECLVVGELETNCYILSANKNAQEVIVVDPGAQAELILEAVGKRRVAAVMLTHGHFDHTGALHAFEGCDILIHEKDAPMLKDSRLSAGELMRDHAIRPEATHFYKEGDIVCRAGIELKILETPGHTMGSVCLQQGSEILTGDTLFDGSYGRTDLPGGSATLMRESLKRLYKLSGSNIYPGHGGPSQIP